MSSLKKRYASEVFEKLKTEYGYHSVMEIPRITKIVLNMRVGDANLDKKNLVGAQQSIAKISGQNPVLLKSKKSVAGFKVRKGFPCGYKVTLRKSSMWDFLDRLIQVVLPRIRDFRGLSPDSFDNFGNYNFGVSEYIIFPEIDLESIDKIRGFDIAIITNAKTDKEAQSLLTHLGFPFKNKLS